MTGIVPAAVPSPTRKRALNVAIEMAGGADQLARHLALPRIAIKSWLSPSAPVPDDVFLKLVDFLIEHSAHDAKGTG